MRLLTRIILLCVISLMLLGGVLVFSASGTYSQMKFNNFYYLFNSHLWKILAAIGVMIIFASIPYEFYKRYSKQAMFGIVFLLVLTLFIAPSVKGASRWINLGFIQFQPSDLAKIILIMHLAVLIEKKNEILHDFKNGLIYLLFWVFLISGLVLVQPNLSTSMIIILTSFTLLYIGGARLKHILFTLSGTASVGFIMMMLFSHSRQRILAFINSFGSESSMNIQVYQAKVALGSGGLIGKGIGNSRQSDLFLPESYGDFIFSILGEEYGFIGAIVTLLIYLTIFLAGLIIAKKATDKFGQLLAFGLSFNIIISAFINAGVVSGILPTTGITLPFISFGGTSIIVFGLSVGIILSIAKETIKKRELRLSQA
ncbi:MAG: putative peptidoglycan glycosyltransferase FtsW [Melioribacteraceae bacterium]|nr:MAG: putative peptidoglycan glycosyltransferase FtsW [Melioribacteraceae bacterium]